MEPAIKAGSLVLVNCWIETFNVGDAVLLRNSDGKQLIKRITAVDGDNYTVTGDNATDSYDSRHFGTIKKDQIVGRAIWL